MSLTPHHYLTALITALRKDAASMSKMQKDAVASTLIGVNADPPEHRMLLEAVYEMWGLPTDLEAPTPGVLAAWREALEMLPLEVWRRVNTLHWFVRRGNVFDEPWTPLSEGGIQFHFSPRYHLFFQLLEGLLTQLTTPPQTVLDVGCWQGTLICHLLQQGYHVAGTDAWTGAPAALEERMMMMREEDVSRYLGCYVGLAHNVLPTMAPFDIVCCQETLEHVPSAVLPATIAGLLKVTGQCLLLTVPGWDDGWALHLRVFDPSSLASLFQEKAEALGMTIEVAILDAGGVGHYTTLAVRRVA